MVQRAFGTEPRVEAEGTSGQIHSRPKTQTTDQALKFLTFGPAGSLGLAIHGENHNGTQD